MSVQDAAVFPVSLVELLARARQQPGANIDEKLYGALLAHEDTAAWLQAMVPLAFKKGVAVKAVPAARSQWESKARDVVIRAVFATAKNVKEGDVMVPGRGKMFVRRDDMLQPSVHYGLTRGDVDYTALAALQSLHGVGYTLDAEEVQAQAHAAEAQRDWAHAEHELQGVDADLKALGIFADNAEEAAAQLLAAGNPDPELLARLEALGCGYRGNPVRDYGTFQARAWYEPDPQPGRSVQPRALHPRVEEALAGALFVTGDWESLRVPRALKAEAFDRLVELLTAALQRKQVPVVAADTDDLVGKAAVMAARRLGLKTVAVQLAGWDFKPARMQLRWCERMPSGADVPVTRAELQVRLAELVGKMCSLGKVDEILAHNLARQGKPRAALDTSWTRHNGLY